MFRKLKRYPLEHDHSWVLESSVGYSDDYVDKLIKFWHVCAHCGERKLLHSMPVNHGKIGKSK